jgi:uncharacterized repeat protein (TIGR03803 family)
MRTQGRLSAGSAVGRSMSLAIVSICLASCGSGDKPAAAPTPTPTPVCGGAGYQKLHDFDGANGKYPGDGALAQGSDGTLYGAAGQGGTNLGLIYRMNTDGSGFAAIHQFRPADGSYPQDVFWVSGQLYGTTCSGGASNEGVVYTLQPDGSGFRVLHEFSGEDGYCPDGLVPGPDGALYGVTLYGGVYDAPSGGRKRGVVFKLNPDGSGFRKLHDINPSQGCTPYGPLARGSDGSLYGATVWCGPTNDQLGSLFRVNTDGSGFTLIHEFSGTDGSEPASRLVQGSDGALYGMAARGGRFLTLPGPGGPGFPGYGVVFKVNTDGGGYTTLHDFDGSDGKNPFRGALVQWRDGALYGTTYEGGATGRGVIFKVNPDGSGFTKLLDFDGVNGRQPSTPFLLGADGALYGATATGGAANLGVAFRYCP